MCMPLSVRLTIYSLLGSIQPQIWPDLTLRTLSPLSSAVLYLREPGFLNYLFQQASQMCPDRWRLHRLASSTSWMISLSFSFYSFYLFRSCPKFYLW